MFSSALPQPRTTHVSGSSATITGRPGLFHQQAVDVAQQRAAAGEHHAALGDVGAELGRRALERALHRRHDAVQRIGERFEDLVRRHREAARDALGEVAALHFHFLDLGAGERGADRLLDQLGGRLADQHAVVAADVVDDRLVELVAAHAHAARVHHAAQRDHADLGGAAADVDDHRAGRVARSAGRRRSPRPSAPRSGTPSTRPRRAPTRGSRAARPASSRTARR